MLLRLASTLTVIIAANGCARPVATATATGLTVKLLYPTAGQSRQMGQGLKSIVQVLDEQGAPLTDAQVTLNIADPSGEVVIALPAVPGSGDVYRTENWSIPHRARPGAWSIQVEAQAGSRAGAAATTFEVKDSVAENLLSKYGFWVDAPTLKGINPDLFKEQGDAQNGVIIWGGLIPMQHIYIENWLEVHWRQGRFDLSSADRVRAFMLNDLGEFGIYPTRALGAFEPFKFKSWDAWQATALGQLARYDTQWVVFYSPEADKTYAIGTMVVLPPPGIDPHATLRDGFEVHPELHAAGVAPAPLPHLVRAPELLSPALGSRVMGAETPIVLNWKPVRALAQDEYYEVKVDYDYSESNNVVRYATRDTQMVLPASLYASPNCGIFNWQVTLMRQTGTDAEGQPEGKALSYHSLYFYVDWRYPLGAPMPFSPRCPNPLT
jgi:hypothetical protein